MLTDCPIERSASGRAPALSGDEVHVWFAELDHPDAVVQGLGETLCPEECRRANRFRFKHDRQRFVEAGPFREPFSGVTWKLNRKKFRLIWPVWKAIAGRRTGGK